MNSRHIRVLPVLALGLSASLAACGVAGGPAGGASPTPEVSVTSPASVAPSPDPSDGGSASPAPSASPSPTPSASPSASGTPGDGGSSETPAEGEPTVVQGADRTLLLSDAFDKESWEEGNYRPVGEAGDVQALAVEVGCNNTEPEVLEFRFSGADGYTLRASVAQELYSDTATASLEFALVVDGRRKATKTIKFKDKGELVADLTGVAVVRLTVVHPDGTDEECDGQIRALVTRLVMTSQ